MIFNGAGGSAEITTFAWRKNRVHVIKMRVRSCDTRKLVLPHAEQRTLARFYRPSPRLAVAAVIPPVCRGRFIETRTDDKLRLHDVKRRFRARR